MGRRFNNTRRIWMQTVLAALVFPMLQMAALSSAHSCTAWAVAGDRVRDGGTLLAKNRDWKPEEDELKLVTPEKGFRYMALLALRSGRTRWVVAGINEKELAVISTTVSSIPKQERLIGKGGINEKILANFDSVDAVIHQKGKLSENHPTFLMLADRHKIAYIEIAPGGDVAAKVSENGTLCHTNHYIDSGFLWANKKVGTSSSKRLHRIEQLLTEHSSPLTLDDFAGFSDDRHDGPDDSIWRTGSSPGRTRTLATWIVSIPESGFPSLYVKLANPGEAEKTFRLKLDETFWNKGRDGGILR
jgi:isopenicillin-N N-acyltransferase like protein